MALSTKALVTLADARAMLGKKATDTADDAIIEMLIESVSEKFDAFCGRALAKLSATTLYLDGNGEKILLLPRYPVVSIAAVAENDVALTEGQDEDFRIYADEGWIEKLGARWSRGNKNIKLTTYLAGYVVQGAAPGTGETALPGDIKWAALQQVAADFKSFHTRDQGEVSRSTPDGSVTRQETGGLLREVKDTLNRYRDIRI